MWLKLAGRQTVSIIRSSVTILKSNMSHHPLTVLFEDESIVVIDKPPNILSVPGKRKEYVKSRNEEWHDAIRYASTFVDDDPLIKECCVRLTNCSSIPRKEVRFYSFLSRVLKIVDIDIQRSIWYNINKCDESLHKPSFDSIPESLISTVELTEQLCSHKLYPVHRLDMETSGILLYAKTEESCAELGRQFRERLVHKSYLAKVMSHFSFIGDGEDVTLPLRADLNNRPRQVVDHQDGKPSRTQITVLSNEQSNPTAIVKLMPVTGRSHQLRVHMAEIGHPILGDTLYAPSHVISMSPGRLCLHASVLSFAHPITGLKMTLNSLHECDFIHNKEEILHCLIKA